MYQQFDPAARRQPKAIAIAATAENTGATEMLLLSLVGLAAMLVVIAHYAGGGLLARMFAL